MAAGYIATLTSSANKTSAALTKGGLHDLGLLDVPAGASTAIFSMEKTVPAANPVADFYPIVLLPESKKVQFPENTSAHHHEG